MREGEKTLQIRTVIMVESAEGTSNVEFIIEVRVGLEAEVPKVKRIDEDRVKGNTDTEIEAGLIGNIKGVEIGLAVDQCREVVRHHQHPWHRVLSPKTEPKESIVEIGTTATNEGTTTATLTNEKLVGVGRKPVTALVPTVVVDVATRKSSMDK